MALPGQLQILTTLRSRLDEEDDIPDTDHQKCLAAVCFYIYLLAARIVAALLLTL